MVWRALSVYGLSLLLGAGVVVVGRLLLDASGDGHPAVVGLSLAALFVLSTFAAVLWLRRGESVGAIWRRAWAGAGAAAVAASGVVVWDASGVAAPEFEGGPRCLECPLAGVERIVDGDTLIVDGFVRGFIVGRERVRLYGIDAPEVGERCAEEATERLRRLAGDAVRLERGPRSEDTHGRRLAYLYREDGRSIDGEMVWGGHAEAWRWDGQHREELRELELDAEASGRGCLWEDGGPGRRDRAAPFAAG